MSNIYDKASLVLIPSGTKTSKVYSQKPTNGDGDFTFSRSTAATRVNASGNIEKETENLLTYSNTFSSWTPANATLTSGQSGYDGSSDAWLLNKTASAANIQLNVSSSGVNTFSYYAKAGSVDWTRLLILGSTNASAYINLTNGAIGVGGGGFIDATATNVGGGWYRVSITHSTAITQVRIYPAPADNDTSGSSGNIYIQDAQLEQGLVARDYIETTTTAIYGGITDNVPRLDYTDSSCPALLLEPQRSNIIDQSEYFGDWTFGSGITLTHNHETSPEGLQNATLLARTTSGNVQQSKSVTSGTTYAVSVFAKAGTSNIVNVITTGTLNTSVTEFDLSEQSITTTTGSVVDSDIIDYDNGWYRCIITQTAASTGTGQVRINTGDNVNIILYGAQLEAGSYATSYIPTYGSAVTRNADAASKTGISSLIGQTEGTLFFEFNLLSEPSDGTNVLASISDASVNNRVTLLLNTIGNLRILLNGSGTQELDRSITAPSGNTKIAFAYKSGENALYVNGVQEWTTTDTFTFSTLSRFGFNDYDGDPYANNPLKKSLVFKTRLTNAELATLTTI